MGRLGGWPLPISRGTHELQSWNLPKRFPQGRSLGLGKEVQATGIKLIFIFGGNRKMIMGWFIPVGILIGAAGTQTALKSRHFLKANKQSQSWWLLIILSWLPSLCWILAQFIEQW